MEQSGEPFTPEELKDLYIGIPPGLWAIVKRSQGRPYVVVVTADESDALSFAQTVGGQVVGNPPEASLPEALRRGKPRTTP